MAITRKDVEHVAGLARLALSDEDKDLYTEQLGRILTHVEKLSEVDTTGVEPTTATVPQRDVRRADELHTSVTNEEALGNAPESAKGCFKVPQIIE